MSATISAASAATTAPSSLSSLSAAVSPEERLLALVVYSQATQMNEAKTTISLNAEQLEKLREQVMKALQDARDAEKDAGFWGGLAKVFGSDLASIVGAVAALAAAVASAGTAVAILAVVATAASIAAEHADELGIPAEVAAGIALAASAAALCCGNTKGLFDVSQEVAHVAGKVKTYATAATLSLKAGGAVCGAARDGYEHAAKYAHADARWADGRQDLVSADMDEAFDRLSAAFDLQNSALDRASSIQQQSAASNFAVLNNWGGAA